MYIFQKKSDKRTEACKTDLRRTFVLFDPCRQPCHTGNGIPSSFCASLRLSQLFPSRFLPAGSEASERRRVSAFVIPSGPNTCGESPARGPLWPIFCAQFAAEECEWRPRRANFGPPIPHRRRGGGVLKELFLASTESSKGAKTGAQRRANVLMIQGRLDRQ